MTKNELDGFQAILRTKVAELKHLTRHRAEIAVERSADQLEEIQAAFVTSTVNLTSFEMPGPGAPGRRAQTPGGALRRIQDGSFGTCQQCDHDIHPKRLADLPWAPFSIRCREAVDRHPEDGQTPTGDVLVLAA